MMGTKRDQNSLTGLLCILNQGICEYVKLFNYLIGNLQYMWLVATHFLSCHVSRTYLVYASHKFWVKICQHIVYLIKFSINIYHFFFRHLVSQQRMYLYCCPYKIFYCSHNAIISRSQQAIKMYRYRQTQWKEL